VAVLVNGVAAFGKAATPMNVIAGVTLVLMTGWSIRHVRDRPHRNRDATARPEMNRHEAVSFTIYLALAILNVMFLTATGIAWWLRG
jgi:hypothetical protein